MIMLDFRQDLCWEGEQEETQCFCQSTENQEVKDWVLDWGNGSEGLITLIETSRNLVSNKSL